jgi:hypothetical protein
MNHKRRSVVKIRRIVERSQRADRTPRAGAFQAAVQERLDDAICKYRQARVATLKLHLRQQLAFAANEICARLFL